VCVCVCLCVTMSLGSWDRVSSSQDRDISRSRAKSQVLDIPATVWKSVDKVSMYMAVRGKQESSARKERHDLAAGRQLAQRDPMVVIDVFFLLSSFSFSFSISISFFPADARRAFYLQFAIVTDVWMGIE
jgi:hypothetical protein